MSLWVLFEYVLYFKMIENYKGWDITLNWDNKDYLVSDITKSNFFSNIPFEIIFIIPI